MASITLRSAVGRPLTNSEVDANFSALNLELGQKLVASLNLLDLPNPAQARSNLGLGNVENKSSATIRGELTSGNVTGALGYTPLSTGGGTLTGQLRAPGMALSGFAVGAAGGNLELGFDGTQTVVQGYNRTSSAYIPIWLESSSLRIGINGSSKVAIDGNALNSLVALQQSGNQVLHAGNYSSYALPLNGGTLSGDLTINHSSASIKAGMWDGVNVRVESVGRPLYLVSYSGDISIGRSSGSPFVIGNTGVSFGGSQVLHAANYANYAISLSGATGISGYFKKPVSDVYVAPTGGTATTGSVQKDIFGWKLVADVSLDNQDGGTQYIDLKTNVISGSSMMYFKLEGYAYNYANVHSYHGLYMYSGSLVLNRYTNNLAGSITFYDSYKAADGSLCLKINMGGVFYTSARARLYVQSHDDNFDALQIVSVKRTNSTAAQY